MTRKPSLPIGVGFTGLGVFLPDRIRTNDWWPEEWRALHQARVMSDLATGVDHAAKMKTADVDPEVARVSMKYAADLFRGSKERRVIGDHQESSDMEVSACQSALKAASRTATDIDLLMMFAQVPDHPAPLNHGIVANKLGLPKALTACTVAAGCSAFLPQVAFASRLVECGEHDIGLLCVSSAISRVTDYTAPSSVNGGDGAVAAVVEKIQDGLGYIAHVQFMRGDLHKGVVWAPKSNHNVRWYDTDTFDEKLTAQNVDKKATHEMGAHAALLCQEACHAVLDKAGYTIDDVDFFILAQSTAWFGEALGDSIGIPATKRLDVGDHYEKYGHLLAASAPLNLYLAHSLGRIKKGDLVLIYSPGIGFTQAALLYRWNLD